MTPKTKIYYWSPYLTPIATSKAVVNSAHSFSKFSKKYECFIINFFGEFNQHYEEINYKGIKLINLFKFNIIKLLPYYGKIKSRFSFLIFFILGFFPLLRLLKNNKPNFLIVHLISSLPLIQLIFFNFETKFILRISGLPRLGIVRKFIWKLAAKKIYFITCPTKSTFNYIKSLNIIDPDKLKVLYDPIIEVREINKKKRENTNNKDNFFLAVGRLTKQKNFLFLCKAFKKIIYTNSEYKKIKLFIAGDGEEKSTILSYLRKNNLENNIYLIGYKKNIFPLFKDAKGFILSSLWEDPGFVLIEAGMCRTPIFSSDALPGPNEIIQDNFNGTLFKNNKIDSFIEKFPIFINNLRNNKLRLNNLKTIKKFTIFSHYNAFSKILDS